MGGEEGGRREELGARRALGGRRAGRRRRRLQLRLEEADVLGALDELRRQVGLALLPRRHRRLEDDVAPVQVLLDVEEVLDDHLHDAEEVALVHVGEPVQVVLGEVGPREVLEVRLERVDVDLGAHALGVELRELAPVEPPAPRLEGERRRLVRWHWWWCCAVRLRVGALEAVRVGLLLC